MVERQIVKSVRIITLPGLLLVGVWLASQNSVALAETNLESSPPIAGPSVEASPEDIPEASPAATPEIPSPGSPVPTSEAAVEPEWPAYDIHLTNFEYPYPVSRFTFESQGQTLSMAYMHLRAKGERPTVVLLHGKNFNGAYWAQTANFLKERGYGVLVPDQIGFGKSDKPSAYQYSFAALAQNTHQLLASLDIETPIIVGHSMGGMLAVRYGLQYGDDVARVVLVNPIGLEDYLRYVEYKDPAFFTAREQALTPLAIKNYQQENYYAGDWRPAYDELLKPLVGLHLGPDRAQLAVVNARTYDMIFTQPVIHDMERLRVPVSLIIGTRDRTGPGRAWKKEGVRYQLGRYDRLGKQLRMQMPRLQLLELEGLGHLPHIEDFEKFTTAFGTVLPEN